MNANIVYVVIEQGVLTRLSKGAFVLCNEKYDSNGLYIRLEDFKGDMEVQKQKVLEALQSNDCKYFYEAAESNFSKIPSSPIAYWVSEKMFILLSSKLNLKNVSTPCLGMRTGDNERFLRLWYEISVNKSSLLELNEYRSRKWIPFNKGGSFRRWYGNNEYLVNWENDGKEIKDNTKIKYGENIGWKISNEQLYFKKGITWGSVTSGKTSFRFYPNGFIFSNCGQAVISNEENDILPILGFLNSNITVQLLEIIAPTIGCESGYVAKLPFSEAIKNGEIADKVKDNIELSKNDWDSFETSWDFKKHPLI